MTTIIINPGSGPVANGREDHADANMRAFCADLGIAPAFRALEAHFADGRYRYWLEHAGETVEIDMPGLELDKVRYVSIAQNAWDFPRLYVDGSSWLWEFALDIVRGTFGLTTPTPENTDGAGRDGGT